MTIFTTSTPSWKGRIQSAGFAGLAELAEAGDQHHG